MAVKTGDLLTVDIHDIAFGGEGVGRVDDFVVFVPFVLVGERVEVEITEVKKNFARGLLRRMLQVAAARVQPACQYFGGCGGCQYQHMDYATQLAVKQKQIADLFERIGKIPRAAIAPVVQYAADARLAWLDDVAALPFGDFSNPGDPAHLGNRQHPDHDT